MQWIFTNKCFLFTVGSVCRVKRFTTGTRSVADISLMTKRLKRRCGSRWDKSKDFNAAGFDALVKRWDICISVWCRICREIKIFFSRFEYRMFYVVYQFVTYLLTLPHTSILSSIHLCNYLPSISNVIHAPTSLLFCPSTHLFNDVWAHLFTVYLNINPVFIRTLVLAPINICCIYGWYAEKTSLFMTLLQNRI
jgi:hypothetical protein